MSTEPKKWTKKDIATLCGQLDTHWLKLRFGLNASEEIEVAKAMRSEGEKARREIVLAGLRAWRELLAQRYNEQVQTIGNQIVRFTEWGKGDASAEDDQGEIVGDTIVRRFTKLAGETDKAHRAAEALVLRVHHEGLPPEVVSYDPTSR